MANILKIELTDDPLGRGYSGMSDIDAANDLNTAYRSQNKSSLNGNSLFTATDSTEFAGLTEEKRSLWVSWCSTDRDPFNTENIAFVNWIFDGASATLTALAAIRTENISRASELGIGTVKEGYVALARGGV